MKSFDPTKPVQTREGCPARIICTDADSINFPIVALYCRMETKGEKVSLFTSEGRYYDSGISNYDLVNMPVKHKQWLNIYNLRIIPHATREIADINAMSDRIACIEIEFTEGQGL